MKKIAILLVILCGVVFAIDDFTGPITYSPNTVLTASNLNIPTDSLEAYLARLVDSLDIEFIRFTDFADSALSGSIVSVSDSLFADTATFNVPYLNSGTATRLLQTDANKIITSVSNLTSWIAGTSDQVTVSNDGDGTLTLSIPQSIATTSNVEFNKITVDSIVAQSGAKVLVVDTFVAMGSVGIGTANPLSKLHITNGDGPEPSFVSSDLLIIQNNQNSSDDVSITLLAKNDGDSRIFFGDDDSKNSGQIEYEHTSDQMVFKTNGSDKLWIKSDGNVGVGTDSPGLDVAGGSSDFTGTLLHVKDASGSASVVTEGSTGAFLSQIDLGGASDDKVMQFITDAGVSRFVSLNDDLTTRLDNILVMDMGTGDVGIGAASSGSDLDVTGAAEADSFTTDGTDFFTYDDGFFETTCTGFTSAVNDTVYYTKIGKMVTLSFGISGLSNADSVYCDGLPAGIWPSQIGIKGGIVEGTTRPAAIQVSGSEYFDILDFNGTSYEVKGWATSGPKSISGDVTYRTD